MPAGSMHNYLKKQKNHYLTETHVKKLVIQVALGIQEIHSHNIVHRDIKLENLLMTDFSEDAQVRIADFGSAFRLNSREDFSIFRIGTPGYTAPELLLKKPYRFGIDIWALGVLMHVLMTMKMPFWNNDQKKRNKQICFEPLIISETLHQAYSEDAIDLMTSMLIKEPEDRPTID